MIKFPTLPMGRGKSWHSKSTVHHGLLLWLAANAYGEWRWASVGPVTCRPHLLILFPSQCCCLEDYVQLLVNKDETYLLLRCS